MTQQELEVIINSDLPVNKKSELIKQLYDVEHADVHLFKEGGKTEEESSATEVLKDQQGAQITITIETESPKEEIEEFNASPMTISIGGKSYDVRIADTEESRRIGLSKEKELPEDEGMLFVFEDPSTSPFTMAETSIDLDIIFIDEEGEVIEVHSVKAHDEKPVKCKEEYCYVLEVNYDSGIEEGDQLESESEEFSDDDRKYVNGRMLVLNSEGDVQAKIEAGCRIFSRISTRKMIKKALFAYKEDTEAAYKKVGKYVCYELNQQDQRKPQYTQAPENNNKEE